jgi:uracil-DNA glycosylase
LLLNNVLTVRKGEAASHSKRGWEDFTDAVIRAVVERDDDKIRKSQVENAHTERGRGVVFLLWGKPASVKAQTVLAKYARGKTQQHAIITCSHPSPLGATKTDKPFMQSKCFSRANEELVKRGWTPVDWRVDGDL